MCIYIYTHIAKSLCYTPETNTTCVHAKLFLLCLTVTLMTVVRQAPLSMGFSRQEYWNGLPFPSPGDLPDPGIKPASPALADGLLPSEPQGKPSDSSLHCPNSMSNTASKTKNELDFAFRHL